MTELKPCPFCGGEYAQVRYMGGKWQEPSAFGSGYRGECCDCGAMTAAYDTEAEAIAAWNSRVERTCRDASVDSSVQFYCSECECTVDVPILWGAVNYCPNCGSRVVE